MKKGDQDGMPRITKDEIEALCERDLPFAQVLGTTVDDIGRGTAVVRLPYKSDLLRPGGTISGPAMMGLADFGAFVAVLSLIGPVEMAVTTSLTCNFLRRPGPADLLAQARILKLGKRLAYGDVEIFSEADRGEGPVAHATATYSIPPQG